MYNYDFQQNAKSKEESEVPVSNRSCTDIICLVLFILFWVATGAIMVQMRSSGDFSKIMRPYDGGKTFYL